MISKIIIGGKLVWGGITLAGIGSILATITGEGLSGTLVAVGGVAVVAYGVWSAMREKIVKDAMTREEAAHERAGKTLVDLEDCRATVARLKARLSQDGTEDDAASRT